MTESDSSHQGLIPLEGVLDRVQFIWVRHFTKGKKIATHQLRLWSMRISDGNISSAS
jgi:hypothetical protein